MAAHYFPYIAGLVVLGVLVFFHELGHFVAAKLCGVRVEVFSLGFGPRLVGATRGDTDYRVSALPLGGYVRMAGDNPAAERTGAEYEFLSRPRWQRFLIAVAGPITNILVAFVIYWGIYGLTSEPFLPPMIEETKAGSPAQLGGLKPGDMVVSIGGKAVATASEAADVIHSSGGRPLVFALQREGKEVQLTITPQQSQVAKGEAVWMIGAYFTQQGRLREGFFPAGRDAAVQTVFASGKLASVLAGLFSGRYSVRDLAGPVGIVQLSGQAARSGALRLFELTAMISLNLGLINLLPIPVMDGGHVLMLAIEGALRRNLSVRFKERFVQVGLIFLLGLFSFLMYSDILRLVQYHGH